MPRIARPKNVRPRIATPPLSGSPLLTVISWISAKLLPDTDTTVIIAIHAADEPVWLGYWDSAAGSWHTVEGERVNVTHWAGLPLSPAERADQRKSK